MSWPWPTLLMSSLTRGDLDPNYPRIPSLWDNLDTNYPCTPSHYEVTLTQPHHILPHYKVTLAQPTHVLPCCRTSFALAIKLGLLHDNLPHLVHLLFQLRVLHFQLLQLNTRSNNVRHMSEKWIQPGSPFNIKTIFPGIRITTIKTRQSWDCLILGDLHTGKMTFLYWDGLQDIRHPS